MRPEHHAPASTKAVITPGRIVFATMLAIAAFFLISEHRAHALGFLPYLLFLACPLLHMFHHGGHGEHGSDAQKQPLEGQNAGQEERKP
jgi:hypothetical protein